MMKQGMRINQYEVCETDGNRAIVRDTMFQSAYYVLSTTTMEHTKLLNTTFEMKTFPEIINTFECEGTIYVLYKPLEGDSLKKVVYDIEFAVKTAYELCISIERLWTICNEQFNMELKYEDLYFTAQGGIRTEEAYNFQKYVKCTAAELCRMITYIFYQLLTGQDEVASIRKLDPSFSYTLNSTILLCLTKKQDFELSELERILLQYKETDALVYQQDKSKRPKKIKINRWIPKIEDFQIHDIKLDWIESKQCKCVSNMSEIKTQCNHENELVDAKINSDSPAIKDVASAIEKIEKEGNIEETNKVVKKEIPLKKIINNSSLTFSHFSIKIKLGVVLGFIMAVGIGGFLFQKYQNDKQYQTYVDVVSRSTDQKEKIQLLHKAIELIPSDTRAYEKLLDVYLEDAVFSAAEEKSFLQMIHKHWESIKKSSTYGKLSYRIGKAYWYYYVYDKESNEEITRMKSAVPWFSDCLKYKNTSKYHTVAKIYCEIGKFNKEITLNVREGTDHGVYKRYFTNINKLLEIGNSNTVASLELYKLVINSVDTYKQRFLDDGVTLEKMNQVRQETINKVKNISPVTEKENKLKEEILN